MEADESASRADQQSTGVSAVEGARVRAIWLRPGQQDQVGLQVEVDPTAGRTGIGRSLSDSDLQVFKVECQLPFSCTTFAANLATYYTEKRAEASLSRAVIGHTVSISARMPGNRPESGCTTRPHEYATGWPARPSLREQQPGSHTRPSRRRLPGAPQTSACSCREHRIKLAEDGKGGLDPETVAELRRLARSRPRSGREAPAKASALRTLERLNRGKRQVPPMPVRALSRTWATRSRSLPPP